MFDLATISTYLDRLNRSSMSFFRSFKLFQKRNSLSRMTYSGDGTRNLPVEIWQEIFKIAEAYTVLPADIDNEIQTNSSIYEVLSFDPSILTQSYQLQPQSLFDLRLSIILVCNSWYYMGIAGLWSHVRLKYDGSAQIFDNLYQTLKRNHGLASCVFRVSLEGSDGHQWSNATFRTDTRMEQICKAMIPLLPNLLIFALPHNLACGDYPSIEPEITLIHKETNRYPMFAPITKGQHFWHRSKVLLLSYPGGRHPASSLGEETSSHIFPNLISLKLDVEERSTVEWINTTWTIPKLRTLSITTPHTHNWSTLLERSRLTLVSLELLVHPGLVDRFETFEIPLSIVMPQLKSMSLALPTKDNGDESTHIWMNHIQAPLVHRLIFHIHYLTALDNKSKFLRSKVDAALRFYPTVKELGIYYHSGKHVLDPDKFDGLPILAMEDLAHWCSHGMAVNVRKVNEKVGTVYPPDTDTPPEYVS
jgi:hypothetical protein